MTWWQRLWRRKRLDEELDKELRFHLEQHTNDLVALGYTPAEARRQAVLALGGAEQVKEECRDARGTRWLEDLLQDFRYAFRRLRSHSRVYRRLRRNPGTWYWGHLSDFQCGQPNPSRFVAVSPRWTSNDDFGTH